MTRFSHSSNKWLAPLAGHFHIGIALMDSNSGQVYEVNRSFAEIAGRSSEDLKTIDWMSITHPEDVQENLDLVARMNAGEIRGFQWHSRIG
jgi:PAS domain S-box-containing protein